MKQVFDAVHRASGSSKNLIGFGAMAVNVFAPQLGLAAEAVEAITNMAFFLIGGTAIADFGKAAAREKIAEARKIREEMSSEMSPAERKRIMQEALDDLFDKKAVVSNAEQQALSQPQN